ncbi:DUF3383 domain-containing protein [Acinetobacter ursingii]|uniref:DUF3383 domain-containing protein n=1 Tax=Acinetobacter ursingii TaxID=108980 RepID=UPI0021CD5AF8|nr:DUF3383 domain-containing protein [Acinetobacter ursingii]MCU4483559.1 DUF3383 domain-containing protein [Acinetobacter ursingii]MCU4507879.1 DUF3383 domain-containing protein [Acinetobacter ursingii]
MTLPVSSVVNVSISLAALAAGPRSFGSLLILGSTSGVIDTTERMREYSSIKEVGQKYGVDDPEYKAALAYFGQSPKPRTLYIGYWHKDGQTPETIQAAVTACLDSLNWYGLVVASDLTDDQVLSVASLIEASDPVRVFGHTTQVEDSTSATSKTDTAYKLSNAKYRRTFCIFSSTNAYAAASVFGRAFSVNFNGTNTTITLKFKQLPGITPEDLKISEANSLTAKHCNVFASYNNDTAILQEGVMCDGSFIDEIHGLDWLQNHLENSLWNLYYTSTTKIPQTAAGVNRQCGVLERACEQGMANGLLGEGQWNGDSFGALNTGDYLPKGFYVYANSLDDQAQSEREARKAPVFQIAAKLAGAVHFADVVVSVNR